MKKMDVKHFLAVYQMRLKMQQNGKTNPSPEVKDVTIKIVDKLSKLPLDEEIKINGRSLIDSKGNIIATFPDNDPSLNR